MTNLRTVLAIAIATVVVLLATDGNALASRPATPQELSAVSQMTQIPEGCVDAKFTTLEGLISNYGVVRWRVGSGCAVETPTMFYVVQQWSVGSQVGAWEYPAEFRNNDACPLHDVPIAVSTDLGVCPEFSPLPYYAGYSTAYGRNELQIKPKKFSPMGHGYLKKLKWKNWNSKQALARGIHDYSDRYDRWKIPVKVRLYRPSTCANGLKIFTRREVSAVRKRDRAKVRYLSSSTFRVIGDCEYDSETPID